MSKKVTVTSPTHTGEPAETPVANLEASAAGNPAAQSTNKGSSLPEGAKAVRIDGKLRVVRVTKRPSGDSYVEYLD